MFLPLKTTVHSFSFGEIFNSCYLLRAYRHIVLLVEQKIFSMKRLRENYRIERTKFWYI